MANPLTQLARILLPTPEDFQQRSIELAASFDDQINILTRNRQGPAWRSASIDEALGVPAIWGAVSLIADTVGSLSLEAFRNEQLLPATERPRLIIRPNPFTAPYAFFRDTAFYRASRGEFWWWIAARDTDGVALSLYPVPPWEIVVEINPRNRLRPIIKWADRIMPNEDMVQSMYMPDGLRGKGPLQACGAAISVAVESQTWAANFFGSNIPSLIGETEQDMDANEMALLKEQWMETEDANLPRFVTNGLTLKTLDINPEQAQLTESRQHSVGDAAAMFNIPGSLLEYQMSGSSLRYQNDQSIWTDFQRRCLSPHYLEPIEQEISDLLTRATVARFNVKQLLRASPKERMEVHKIAIESGIYTAEVAAQEEGYAPGNVDYAPVPLALPAATPSRLPIETRSQADGFRCSGCNRKLAESAGAGTVIRCPKCKTLNTGPIAEPELEMRSMLAALMTREQPAPVVTMNPAPVNVTFERGAFQVDAPEPTQVRVEAPVTVNVPEQPPAEVTVNLPEPTRTSKRIERDDDGHLIRIVEETA